ncbi:MAG: hypothetical protein EA381_14435 [Planctomycetaceae bacterium]|nr:MAG: hypothetical protein EA381_14435 [Planctomycetaceae bacterium]
MGGSLEQQWESNHTANDFAGQPVGGRSEVRRAQRNAYRRVCRFGLSESEKKRFPRAGVTYRVPASADDFRQDVSKRLSEIRRSIVGGSGRP